MAGLVHGHLLNWADGTINVLPEVCAVEDIHRIDTPVCYRTYIDGTQRSCLYFTSCAQVQNFNDRVHPTMLRTQSVANGSRQMRCSIICQAQKRNRPAGC
jgi:hypothetical protein